MHANQRSHRLISNVLVLVSGQVGQWVLSAAYVVLMSHYLGPARYGELALAISVVAMLALITGAGADAFISRTVARSPERSTTLVMSALVLRMLLAFPAILALLIFMTLLHYGTELRLAAFILIGGMLLGQLDDVFVAMFRGSDRMVYVSAVGSFENLVILVLASAIVLLHGTVLTFAAAIAIAAALRLILIAFLARRFVHFTLRISQADLLDLIGGSVALWANALFMNFYFYIDAVILGAIAGSRAVGYYSPCIRLLTMLIVLPMIVLNATQPVRARLGLAVTEDFLQFNRRLVVLLLALSIPIGIGLATFAGPIIDVAFGSAFRPSIPVLVVFGTCVPFAFMNPVFAEILISRDKQHRWSIIMGCSAIVNPLLNVYLIPFAMHHWHNGALGAALALLGTEVLMTLYGVVILRQIVLSPFVARVTGYALAAGALQFGIVFLSSGHLRIAGEIVGVVLYLAVVVVSKVFPPEDFLMVRQVLLSKVGGRAA